MFTIVDDKWDLENVGSLDLDIVDYEHLRHGLLPHHNRCRTSELVKRSKFGASVHVAMLHGRIVNSDEWAKARYPPEEQLQVLDSPVCKLRCLGRSNHRHEQSLERPQCRRRDQQGHLASIL